ncbi:MAG: hypothetical protein JNL83_05695 [Myxococcales bacterium]|nr:hypothetical protein [Myxococcales bacterium]
MSTVRITIALALGLGACASDRAPDPGVDAAPASTDEAQLAPQGHAALTTWLAAGHYRAWACELAPHPARPPGAHGMNRICSNAALSASAAGPYPVGAVAVKELFTSSGAPNGFAVARKLDAGWYWYELYGSSVVADGVGAGLCVSCHEDAPRDHVFTRVE